jgi:hypothetical protein
VHPTDIQVRHARAGVKNFKEDMLLMFMEKSLDVYERFSELLHRLALDNAE